MKDFIDRLNFVLRLDGFVAQPAQNVAGFNVSKINETQSVGDGVIERYSPYGIISMDECHRLWPDLNALRAAVKNCGIAK